MCANLAACCSLSYSLSLRERAGASRCGSRSACALLDSVKKGGLSPASGLQDRDPRSRFQSLVPDFPTLTLTLSRQREREKAIDARNLALIGSGAGTQAVAAHGKATADIRAAIVPARAAR